MVDSPNAKRHRTELAAKATSAKFVRMKVFKARELLLLRDVFFTLIRRITRHSTFYESVSVSRAALIKRLGSFRLDMNDSPAVFAMNGILIMTLQTTIGTFVGNFGRTKH